MAKNRRALREEIVRLLREGNFSGLVDLAGQESAVAGQLMMFLFDPRDLLLWRATEGLGHVGAAHPAQVQKLISRLLYLLNEDSGSSGWGAAAALGEIGRHKVSLVAEIIPMFYGFLEERYSRAPMLWGVGRLAEVHPELLKEIFPLVPTFLGDADPLVRALSAWCLGKARHQEAAAALEQLVADANSVEIYEQGDLRQTTVGQVARQALAGLEIREASR